MENASLRESLCCMEKELVALLDRKHLLTDEEQASVSSLHKNNHMYMYMYKCICIVYQ